MNIRSTIRAENPGLQAALAKGDLRQPSVILRTPSGHRDLLLTQQGTVEPNLRRLLSPLASLAQTAIDQWAPEWSGMASGVCVVIDLTSSLAGAIEESQFANLEPVDGTGQLSQILQRTDPGGGERQRGETFGKNRTGRGMISFLASFDDDRTMEAISPVEQALAETPLLSELYQIGDGILKWLDASEPSSRLATTSVDPVLMEQLRIRLATHGNNKRAG